MGLLNPAALVFASLYVILVLLYLWERFRRRVDVPSMLLWQAVPEDVVQARRFRPDLLFLLQLLLLAGLIGGLARPYIADGRSPTTARRHILVLDTSASMQAHEGRATRFDAARDELRHRLHALPAGDEAMLITAAAHPEIVADFTRDHDALERALDAVTPTDTGTELDLALAVAAGARERTDAGTDVQVFSDLPASQLPPRWRDEVSVMQFGETDANLAITALQIFQSRFQDPRAARASVVVQNFSHREGHGGLTVTLNDTPVLRTGFTIPARDTRSFLVSRFPGPGRVAAQLDADDALAADNLALGWVRPLSTTHVLVVSAATPLIDELQTVARATDGMQLTVVAPGAYDPHTTPPPDLVIFHRVVPSSPPATAALYVDPPPGNPLFTVVGDAHGVEVLDWNEQHPIIGPLRPLAALPISHARIIEPAEWHQPLLLARTAEREFSLVFVGDQGGHRLACISFDLEAQRLLSSDNVGFLLFFLNLVNWLAPDASDVVTVPTGTVLPLVGLPDLPATAIDPHGRQIDLGIGNAATLDVLTAGEYRVSADGVSRTVYANFFDPLESDIGRAGKEPPGPAVAAPPAAARAHTHSPPPGAEFGWWLLAAGAGLLLIEWTVAMRRARS